MPVTSQAPQTLQIAGSPGRLRKQFFSLGSRADLADLLEVREKDLIYYSVRRKASRYRAFLVRKRSRSGGSRRILEPVPGLKAIQAKLLQVLSSIYRPPPQVHGFVLGRSIATNALVHERGSGGVRDILTVDLEDFFGSVNFGRVRGLLMARGYGLPADLATLIAQLTTHDNGLPQGAPTSPILSNMVAARLDRQLGVLAPKHGCAYSRYADDLTFSSDRGVPQSWVEQVDGAAFVSGVLREVIEANGFTVADRKTHFVSGQGRRLVTGLLVNERVNLPRAHIRRVRGMLNAWEKHGETAAQSAWVDRRDRRPGTSPPTFRQVIRGMVGLIGMVRGVDDYVYDDLNNWYCRLAGEAPRDIAGRPWNHLRRIEDAVWVFEADNGHGTAVFTDQGLVTCQHVLGPNPVVFHPHRPTVPYPVTVLASDRVLDLALLAIEQEPPCRLPAADMSRAASGETLRVLGYPDYNEGQTLVDALTREVGRRDFAGRARILIDYNVSKGMSGGALVDRRGRIIGVIATHVDLYNSVVPIADLWILKGMAGLA